MRILFVSYDGLSVGDGGARSAAMVMGLADAGHSVDVLAVHVKLPAHERIRVLMTGRAGSQSACRIGWTLYRTLLRERYDVVHAVDDAALSAHGICRWRSIPLVYDAVRCLSGKAGHSPGRIWCLLPGLLRRCERHILRRASMVIAGCELLISDLQVLEPDVRIRLLGGVPLQPLVPSSGRSVRELLDLPRRPPQLVVVRMLSAAQPQLRMMLVALRKVVEAIPDLYCVIRGVEASRAESLAANLDIAGRCRFLNDGEMEVYTACLQEADAALLIPGVGRRYPHPAVYALLHSRAPLVAVQDMAHEALLEEAGAVSVLPSAQSIADGLSRTLQEPLFSRTLPDGERESVRRQYTYSSFKHTLRMIYRSLLEED